MDLSFGQVTQDLVSYKVIRVIGSGSFATVFLALDQVTRTILLILKANREVAVKAIRLSRLNAKLIEGFRMEAKIMQEICHPNIVRLLKFHVKMCFQTLIDSKPSILCIL